MVEDGATTDSQRAVLADGETIEEEGVFLDQLVELELGVGNDSTGTAFLVFEDAVLQSDDRSGPADGSDLSLLSESAKRVRSVTDKRLTLSS